MIFVDEIVRIYLIIYEQKGLKIFIVDKDRKFQRKIKNVGFKEVFNNFENGEKNEFCVFFFFYSFE